MDSRKIFDAIDACDDAFIGEVVLDMEKRRKKQDSFKRLFFNKNQHLSGIRVAAVIVLFIAILGVGVKTTAHISVLFHDWMEEIFQKSDVMKIIPDSTTVDIGNSKISLKNDVQMTGQKETFLYETSYDGEENLKTGEVQSELTSKTAIDFVMAPNGRYVLVKYNLIQSDGSVKRKWTVFNLQTKEEKNLEKLEDKNLEIDTSNFVDATHIAVGGKIDSDGEYKTLYYTDISTGKTKEYNEYGNVTPEWNCDYSAKKKTTLFRNIVTGEEFLIKNIETDPSYSTSIYKDYFLIWNEEDLPAYLCNIKRKTAVKLNPPEELRYTLQMYFSQKENALLFTNEKEVYLVNLEK